MVVVIGAVSKGSPHIEYADDLVSISRYQLSTTNCIAKILDSFEEIFNIL
jgi:rRNA pseudouridine-1189 N-methylase Emg1 (Nep1/Mra1 family)